MALRALSGLIIPKDTHRNKGEAFIEFFPHRITGDVVPPLPHHMEEAGPSGEFTSEPCKMVAVREITVVDTDTASPNPGTSSHLESWKIQDNFVRETAPAGSPPVLDNAEETPKHKLWVTWEARRDAEFREISYMVIGEAR